MATSTKRGRKDKWSIIKENLDKIEKLSSNGATEKQIAKSLNIAYSTFNKYKAEKKELSEILKKGREDLVEQLRGALIKKALGFAYEEKKNYIKYDEVTQHKTQYTEITKKEALPDVAAINLALKNYDTENWSNDPAMLSIKKQELELRKKMSEQNDGW